LGWRRDPDAALYLVEQWDGAAYVEYARQAATAAPWQQFTTPALADEAVAQWRVTPYDAAGNAGTPTVSSALIVRYPDVPTVEYSYAAAGRLVTIAEPAGVAKVGLQFTVKTDNVSTGSTGAALFKLPLVETGAYNFTVYWGDGTQSTISRWDADAATHTYAGAGTYTVQVEGVCYGFAFNNSGDRLKILDIQRWGQNFRLGTIEGGYFYGCENLEISAQDAPNLAGCVSLENCFRGCAALKMSFSAWDVSGVASLAGMFTACDINEANTTANYDATLAAWAALDVQNNVTFDGGTAKYAETGAPAREHLEQTHSWTISDGGAAA
jgi:hypothetical protein